MLYYMVGTKSDTSDRNSIVRILITVPIAQVSNLIMKVVGKNKLMSTDRPRCKNLFRHKKDYVNIIRMNVWYSFFNYRGFFLFVFLL